ncbi:unnamed protein product [Rhodiola kirilowii]
MSIKLDMSKAYDRIEWSFLEKMMQTLGFDATWVRKIMMCVQSVTYRVKTNENISDLIKPSRGLRQGDPISPYLFLLCAEWLSYAMVKYQEKGLIRGVKISRNAPIISHLMFADDCLLFVKAKSDAVRWLSQILRRYEAVSGQKVNFSKSEVVCSKNVPESFRNNIIHTMGIKIVDVHSKYLGLPLVFGSQKASLFRSIEEKLIRKIGDWKHKLLSGAGREVLVKSILQSLPLYAMSAFKIPIGLCKKLTGDVMKFWWHHGKNKGIHWVKADTLFKGKIEGGMGFRRFDLMNLALLAKQGWRILTEPGLLVSKLFKAKYFPNVDFFNASVGARPSYAWRGMWAAREIIKYGAEWSTTESNFYWSKGPSGTLTVKDAYCTALELERLTNPSHGEQSDARETRTFWRSFWKLQLPNRIKMFGWRLFYDSLPTMQNLERRGCTVRNSCCFCGAAGESALHIFKDCWWMKYLLSVLDLPAAVWDNLCDGPGYWLWTCAKVCQEDQFKKLLCGLWLGWKNRNEIIHGKAGRSPEELKTRLLFMLSEIRKGDKVLSWWCSLIIDCNAVPIIFCDGSYEPKTRRAGMGTVLVVNGKVDNVKAAFKENISSALEAECQAIEMALNLAQEKDLDTVTLLTDSREALWALNMGSWRTEACLGNVRNCIQQLDEHPRWTVESISRKDNATADWLAKKARMDRWEWSLSSAVPRAIPWPPCASARTF